MMTTLTRSHPAGNDRTPDDANRGVDVTVKDSVGALFLGMLSLILLIAFLREESRNRALLAKLSRHA